MKKKVVVGMSGGVDSSVTALLLKEQGYDVIGVTMQIWSPKNPLETSLDSGCCSLLAVDDARRVADTIGIPYYVMNFRDMFKEKVIENFVNEYSCGRTPNPCIMCNRYIKWEGLFGKARVLGADYLATGHYGKIVQIGERLSIHKALSATKDQSYVLYPLTQEQLSHTLFPLSDMEKPDVRAIAMKAGLPVAAKKDSEDICFVPDHDYAGFICKETGITMKSGNFVDSFGNILGKHRGIMNYTVGQRKGLGISFDKPRYVISINADSNEVVLGEEKDTYSKSIIVSDACFMGISNLDGQISCCCKVRYSQKESPCIVSNLGGGKILASFEREVRSPAPGQSAVFYMDGYILFGGIIERCDAIEE